MRCRAAGSSSSRASASATAARVIRPPHHEAGLAVDHRLGGAAAVARDLGHAGGGRLEEHDAEALLLQPTPPVPAEHGEDVAAAVEAWGGRRGAPDRGAATGRREVRMSRCQAVVVAPATGDGHE